MEIDQDTLNELRGLLVVRFNVHQNDASSDDSS